MFSQILNPFLKTRNEIKNSEGKWVEDKIPKRQDHLVYFENRDISDVDDFVLFDIPDKKVIIKSLEISWSGGASKFFPRLHTPRHREGRTESNLFIGMNGNLVWDLTGLYVRNHGHPLMEMLKYDTSNLHYKMGNKRDIVLENGGILSLRKANNYTTNDRFHINLFYTTEEIL